MQPVLLAAAWLRPLPKAAAPVARLAGQLLALHEVEHGHQQAEMPGSVALSAASKTTASRPAIRRI
jgi:hypothetical protein